MNKLKHEGTKILLNDIVFLEYISYIIDTKIKALKPTINQKDLGLYFKEFPLKKSYRCFVNGKNHIPFCNTNEEYISSISFAVDSLPFIIMNKYSSEQRKSMFGHSNYGYYIKREGNLICDYASQNKINKRLEDGTLVDMYLFRIDTMTFMDYPLYKRGPILGYGNTEDLYKKNGELFSEPRNFFQESFTFYKKELISVAGLRKRDFKAFAKEFENIWNTTKNESIKILEQIDSLDITPEILKLEEKKETLQSLLQDYYEISSLPKEFHNLESMTILFNLYSRSERDLTSLFQEINRTNEDSQKIVSQNKNLITKQYGREKEVQLILTELCSSEESSYWESVSVCHEKTIKVIYLFKK